MSPCFARVFGFDGGEGFKLTGCPRLLLSLTDCLCVCLFGWLVVCLFGG